ncbi:MAG: hypothetical protein CL583_03080 [Alteromonadaceae bacterium]|nr:hypothetical protein [Alteromonadaceae bacterium]
MPALTLPVLERTGSGCHSTEQTGDTMKRITIAGLVLLVVLAVAAPVVTGSLTRSSWGQMTDEFNRGAASAAVLENLEYDRGYLSTEVLSKLTLDAPELEEPVDVFLRSSIAHGLTSARIETRLDEDRHQAALSLFDQDKPVLISHAHWNGDFESILMVPGVDRQKEGMTFRWAPLDADFAVSDSGESASIHSSWAGLEVTQGANFLRLGQVSVAEDMSRLVGEVWTGEVAFSVAELSANLAGSGRFSVEDATLLARTVEEGDGRLKNQMDIGVAAVEANGQSFSDIQMRFVAENFDIEATNQVLLAANRLNGISRDASAAEQAAQHLELFSSMMDAVRTLMAHGLAVGIPTMVVNAPGGAAELEFHFAHPELDAAGRAAMGSIFQHSTGGLSLKVPASMLEQLPVTFQQRLFQLYQQGVLLEKDGIFLLNVDLEGMTLNVNGQPIPVPPLI